MKKGLIFQGIIFLCILIFIGQFFYSPKDSSAPFNTVVSSSISILKKENYIQEDNRNMRRFLSIDPTVYQSISYYKNKDDMEASELVVVQFKDHGQAQAFSDAMEKRMQNQENTYGGYLPKQADLVKKGVVYTQANYGLYVVNKDSRFISCDSYWIHEKYLIDSGKLSFLRLGFPHLSCSFSAFDIMELQCRNQPF